MKDTTVDICDSFLQQILAKQVGRGGNWTTIPKNSGLACRLDFKQRLGQKEKFTDLQA